MASFRKTPEGSPANSSRLGVEELEAREVPATISGTVFFDADRNGSLDAVEAGRVAGVRIQLTGVVGGAPVAPATATTGADGRFTFEVTTPGTFTLTQTQPDGYASSPTGPFAPNTREVKIAAVADTAADQNFGEVAGGVVGAVYFDRNANGKRDAGEPGLGGVVLQLSGSNAVGAIGIVTTTANDGTYSFGGQAILAGGYSVTQMQPLGFGSSEVPGNVREVTIAAGQVVTGANFGETLGNLGTQPLPDLRIAPDFAAVGESKNPSFLAVGQATGNVVRVYNFANGAEQYQFQPFGPGYTRGVRVATGDVTGDGVADVICGMGGNGKTVVKVFDGVSGEQIASFMPFGPGYLGGAHVAAADINRDGKAEVVVGGGYHNVVKVFNAVTIRAAAPTELARFAPFGTGISKGYTNGVRVSTGDVNDDGTVDVVAVTAAGRPIVAGFSGAAINTAAPFQPFSPYFAAASTINGGWVAAGDVNGDRFADIATSNGTGTPTTIITDGRTLPAGGDTKVLRTLALTPSTAATGVRVRLADLNGDGKLELITAANTGARPVVNIHDATTGTLISAFYAFSPDYLGGVDVG